MPDAATAEVLATLNQAAPPQANLFQTVMFGLVIAAIMYFVLIRPQTQERRRHEELVASLSRDDRVVTASGIHGRVVEVQDATVVVEIADKTRVTFEKAAIVRKADTAATAATASKK